MTADAAASADKPASRRGRSGPSGKSGKSGKAGFTVSLKGRALRLLSGREYSRTELERKLAPHEETPGQLAGVLDELQAKDFISEARVVESVINRRSARFGAARIRHELLNKGLDATRVADAVLALKETELARARDIWQRRFGTPAADARERARQARFLMARGFSGEIVRRVLRAGFDEEN